jgi:ACS family pantothenate transporter-like MFS transporter
VITSALSKFSIYKLHAGHILTFAVLAYPQSTSIHFAMYYWAGSVYACQATFFAWANDVLRYQEDSLRAVVIASMNAGSNAINAWWSIVFYGANFAPYFTRGIWAMIAVSIAMAAWTAALVWMQVRTAKKRYVVDAGRESNVRKVERGSL